MAGKDGMPNPPIIIIITWEDCIISMVVNKLLDLGFNFSKIREVVMKLLVEDCYTIPSVGCVAEVLLDEEDEEDEEEELDEIRTLLRESDIELETTANLDEIRTLLRESDKEIQLETTTNHNNESGLCCICLEETVSVVFLPCRHMCGTRCALKLREKNCHICRGEIRYQIKVFL